LFAIAALLGLHAVLLAVPVLPLALKVVGGLYLAYLGLRIWRAARFLISTPQSDRRHPSGPSRSPPGLVSVSFARNIRRR